MFFETVKDFCEALGVKPSRIAQAKRRREFWCGDDGKTVDTEDERNAPYLIRLCDRGDSQIPLKQLITAQTMRKHKAGKLPLARNYYVRPELKAKTQGRPEPKKFREKAGRRSNLEKIIFPDEDTTGVVAEGDTKRKVSSSKKRKEVSSDNASSQNDLDNEQRYSTEALKKVAADKLRAESSLKEQMLESQKIKNQRLLGVLIEKELALQMYEMTYDSIRTAALSSVGKNIGERYLRAMEELQREKNHSTLSAVQAFNKIHAAVVKEILDDATQIYERELTKLKEVAGDGSQ
jgi:hypothetical protein